MSKVSIIVPVYQVEDYLNECILSCVNQTFVDIEVILINDGSKDGSKKIGLDWTLKDNRIKIFDKENGGLSDARNFGIKKAESDLLFFLDADDVLHPNCIELLVKNQIQNNADMVSMKLTRDRKKIKENYSNKKAVICDKKSTMELILKDNEWGTSACCKVFKKELFNSIKFPKGKLYEDLATIYKIVNLISIGIFIDEYGYYYRESFDSITTSTFNEKQFDLLYYSDEVERFIELKYPDLIKIAKNRKIRCILKIITKMNLQEYKKNENLLDNYNKYLKNNFWLFMFSEYSISHKIFCVFNIISPKMSIKILEKRKGK